MESIAAFILSHAHQAPWFIFGSILLAGMNIPIPIDIIVIAAAITASTATPEYTLPFFLSIWIGCLLSAWISYSIGRFLGKKLSRFHFFNRLAPPERLEKARTFYEKYGFFTLLVGRFIPFGVRNCLFMSSGMSKVRFLHFALRDVFACLIWCTCYFYLFYAIASNYQVLYRHLTTINAIIFSVFSVTAICIFWYKRKKKRNTVI